MKILTSDFKKAMSIMGSIPEDHGFPASQNIQITAGKDIITLKVAGHGVGEFYIPAGNSSPGEICVQRTLVKAALTACGEEEHTTLDIKDGSLLIKAGRNKAQLPGVADVAGYANITDGGTRMAADADVLSDLVALKAFTSPDIYEIDAVAVNGLIGAATDRVHFAAVRWDSPPLRSKKPVIIPSGLLEAVSKSESYKIYNNVQSMRIEAEAAKLEFPMVVDYPLALVSGVLNPIEKKVDIEFRMGDMSTALEPFSAFEFAAPEYIAEVSCTKTLINLKMDLGQGSVESKLPAKIKKPVEGKWLISSLLTWGKLMDPDTVIKCSITDKWTFRGAVEGREYLLITVAL